MKTLKLLPSILFVCNLAPSVLLAQAESAAAAAPGATGVNSAWDQESIDILTGTVNLYIPLYTAHSGDMAEWSVGLSYNSNLWDATDSNYPYTPSARHFTGFGPVGLGWRIGFGRVYSLAYTSGGTTETRYFYEGQRGDTHRLFQEAADQNGQCQPTPYWYAFDGSGVRAQSNSSGWTVWLPDGTTLSMGRHRQMDPNVRPWGGFPEAAYDGWDTTTITGPQPKNNGTSRYSIAITYQSQASGKSMCPDTVTDMDNPSRVVRFTCAVDQYYNDGPQYYSIGTYHDGVVTSIEVPAPTTPSSTQVYQFTYSKPTITDPFNGSSTYGYILTLTSLTAVGVNPVQTYWFFYDTAGLPNVNAGLLKSVSFPFGGGRSYQYGIGNVWRHDYPNIFEGARSGQFGFFPVLGVTGRGIGVAGKTYYWLYDRSNAVNCSQLHPENCYVLPKTVSVRGPYELEDSTVAKSLTVYTYNGTPQSAGTPGPHDGTLAKIEAYAGTEVTAPRLRTTSYEYDHTTPCMVGGAFRKGHYADNVRLIRDTTSFDDDGKNPHDLKVTDYTNWTMLTTNFGRFQDTIESIPNPNVAGATIPYRKTKMSYSVVTGPDKWILTPVLWRRVFDGNDSVKEETDFAFDSYGRMTSARRLFAPGASPLATSQDDLLTTFGYASSSGNRSAVLSQIPRQGVNLGTNTLLWDAGYPTKQQANGLSWYSLDVDREPNWGLATAVRGPSGTGVSVEYDSIGRPTTVGPLAGSGEPPVGITYGTFQKPGFYDSLMVTKVIGGDPLLVTSIQSKTILDGLGRVTEEQVLKTDDQGAAQWVSKKYTYDAVGNVMTESEWAPVGTTGPITTTIRAGTYGGSATVYVDPFLRVRKTIAADGATTLTSYQGLVTTRTVQGIQSGSVASPTTIDSVTVSTADVLGRLIGMTTKAAGATSFDLERQYSYDEMNHPTLAKTWDRRVPAAPVFQLRSTTYDHLGRIATLEEPERGKMWFGTVTQGGTGVDTSTGYDAMGNVVRFADANGFGSAPPFHYLKSYDPAGRLTMVEKEEDQSSLRTRVLDYGYDEATHGNSNSQLGQITSARSYEDDGTLSPPVAAVDYYYQESQYGRFNKMTTTLGKWAGGAHSIFYNYDALGQVSSIVYPTTATTDPTGMPGCTNATCLSMDRVHGQITHIGSSRGYSAVDSALYAESGRLKQWVAGTGIKTIIQPNSMNSRRVNEVKVLNGSNGQLWTSGVYQYDGGGNIKTVGSDVFTYDSIGRLKEARLMAPSGGTMYEQTFAYDPFGNIYSRSQTLTPGPGTTITGYIVNSATNRIDGVLGSPAVWAYDSDGALRQDDQFQYNYDNARRLKQVQVGGLDKGNYSYDAFGLRVYRKEDHGKEVFYFRDADGNVLSQYSRPANVTEIVPQWDRDYVYFGGSRVNMVETPLPLAVAWKTSQATSTQISLEWYPVQYAYGYLVLKKGPSDTEFHPILPGTTPVTTTGTTYLDTQVSNEQTYTYKVVAIDNVGNQGNASPERIIITGNTPTPPPAPSSLAATAGNAYVSLTWAQSTSPPDLAGYYVYRSLTSLGTEVYGTALNSAPITTQAYTDLNVTNGTTYYYKVRAVDTAGWKSTQSNQVSAKPKSFGMGMNITPGSWQGTDEPASDRLAEGSEAISPYATAGQMVGANVLFLHSDHLGSLRLVTNALGVVVTEHKYLPYGEEIQPMKTLDPYRFAGYERDSETGNDYSRARYHSASKGRWLGPDSLGGGYLYALNNPVNFYDPTGMYSAGPPACQQGPTQPGHSLPCTDGITVTAKSPDMEVTFIGFRNISYSSVGVGGGGGGGGVISNFFSNLFSTQFWMDEFKTGGCYRAFFDAWYDALIPIAPSAASFGDVVGSAYGAARFSSAMSYAASRPNSLGGQGLLYPLRSSTVRTIATDAEAATGLGLLIGVVLAEYQALVVQGYQMWNGQCQ
ncbi:MAG TPA: RHS repeat-associated core domain-containing protein [Candidatus Polarisedimenticolia bacterium]|nr:RHS repeat-associated core domain-containing protein [Nitrospirales bacterium]HEV8701813.1 RHS repeat-associated core domain-containing protein [Candidatus Polarisedimenticolia bacterium]